MEGKTYLVFQLQLMLHSLVMCSELPLIDPRHGVVLQPDNPVAGMVILQFIYYKYITQQVEVSLYVSHNLMNSI